MRAKSLTWSACAFLMLFACLPVMAQDKPEAAQKTEAQKTENRMKGTDAQAPAVPQAPIAVSGGPVTKVLAVSNATQQTTKNINFVALTGASRTVTVPAGGDTVVITFSAECELLPSANDGNDWVEIDIRDGATSLVGNGDTSFCGGQDYNQNSIHVVKRLAQGNHVIRVFFRTTDTTKEAWLDDWTLSILQSD